jgi:hypothetical protein
MFSRTDPKVLREAFEEHLAGSKFFPKPAEIAELIEKRAERVYAKRQAAALMTPEERAALEAHQQTAEWQQSALEARAAVKRLAEAKDCPTSGDLEVRPYIPTSAELAEELAKTEHLRRGFPRKAQA